MYCQDEKALSTINQMGISRQIHSRKACQTAIMIPAQQSLIDNLNQRTNMTERKIEV